MFKAIKECLGRVSVSIDTIDPNGNQMHIVTPTSDGSTGVFGCTWTPTIPGEYKIYATFAGDDSYRYSTASTLATVTAAPAATSTATPVATSASNVSNSDLAIYLVVGVIVIIIAIAIVGALILRKR